MRSKVLLIAILLICTSFLMGCKTTLLVQNTTVDQVTPVFKDYVGIHGYKLTYENDQTGAYGLSLGNVYVADTSQTTKTRTITIDPPIKDSSIPLTSREDTTWSTVSVPGHYVEATAMVNIMQQGNGVIIILEGNSVAGTSLNDMKDYLQSRGYQVENK
ncbi:MAG: hypothetical protein V1843_00715 [bacterium]